MKKRLDLTLASRGAVVSRSQAESLVRLGQVKVNGQVAVKAGQLVAETDDIVVTAAEQYVSRAALKLKSADEAFHVDWKDKVILDVGSSTGGFTQYALQHGAGKVLAVDVGTDQLHPTLRQDGRIELHEKTDIRDFVPTEKVDIVVADVSFISLREILPHVSKIAPQATVVAMVKPQFEAGQENLKHKGVVKNERMRRDILRGFENWVQNVYKIVDKKDSSVPGGKGNVERFYLLKKLT